MENINYLTLAKTLDFVVSVGDIHGKYRELGYYIKERYKICNSIIIVAGDIGIGFYKSSYYINEFIRLNKILKATNNIIFFVRGNHDNPAYFNGNLVDVLDIFSHIKLVPDYYVLISKNANILFVGGGISIDRIYRKKNKSYWLDEQINYEYNTIKNIDKHIDIVVTHSAPSFCYPTSKYELKKWFLDDPDLDILTNLDRLNHTKLYNDLVKYKHPLKYWCYGHFHKNHQEKHNNTMFILNSELSFYELKL